MFWVMAYSGRHKNGIAHIETAVVPKTAPRLIVSNAASICRINIKDNRIWVGLWKDRDHLRKERRQAI